MAELEFVRGYYDRVFKKILSDEKRARAIAEIITKTKLDGEFHFEENESYDNAESKGVEADVLFSVSNKNEERKILVDVEAQNYSMNIRLKRRQIHYFTYFLHDMYKKGSDYSEDNRYYAIYIMANQLNNGNYFRKARIIYEPDNIYADELFIMELYIDEILKLDFNKSDEDDKILLKLMRVLVSTNMKDYINDSNELIKDVANVIEFVNKNESERLAAIKQQKIAEKNSIYLASARDEGREEGLKEGREEGRQEGLKEGEAKGIEKTLRNNVLAMHKNGFEAEAISKILELPLEKVEGILVSK